MPWRKRQVKLSVVLSVVPALHHRSAPPATRSSPTASLLSWPHRERASRDLSFCFVVAGWLILSTELTVSREGQVEGASFTVHGLLCTGCPPPPPPPPPTTLIAVAVWGGDGAVMGRVMGRVMGGWGLRELGSQ